MDSERFVTILEGAVVITVVAGGGFLVYELVNGNLFKGVFSGITESVDSAWDSIVNDLTGNNPGSLPDLFNKAGNTIVDLFTEESEQLRYEKRQREFQERQREQQQALIQSKTAALDPDHAAAIQDKVNLSMRQNWSNVESILKKYRPQLLSSGKRSVASDAFLNMLYIYYYYKYLPNDQRLSWVKPYINLDIDDIWLYLSQRAAPHANLPGPKDHATIQAAVNAVIENRQRFETSITLFA